MKRDDVKYYADCLRNNKRIDSNTMYEFCNEVIDSQNRLQKIEAIIHDSPMGLGETFRYIAEVLEK